MNTTPIRSFTDSQGRVLDTDCTMCDGLGTVVYAADGNSCKCDECGAYAERP